MKHLLARYSLALWTVVFALPAPALATGGTDRSESVASAESASAEPEPSERLTLGAQAYAAGHYDRARHHWEAAAKAYAARDDRLGQLQATNFLVLVQQKLGQWEAARQASALSQALLGAVIPPALQAQTYNSQASFAFATGEVGAAIAAWEQAEARYQQAGDRTGVLGSQLNRARALQQLGNLRRAEMLLVAANTHLESEFPDSLLLLSGWQALGNTLFARGDLQAAREQLESALDLATRLAAAREAGALHLALANLAQATGDPEAVATHLEAAIALADSPQALATANVTRLQAQIARAAWSELPATLTATQMVLTELPPSPQRLDTTIAMAANLLRTPMAVTIPLEPQLVAQLDRAAKAATTLGDRRRQARVQLLQARWQGRFGRVAAAQAGLEATLQLAQTLSAPEIAAPAAWELGRLLAAGGDRTAAIAAYQEAISALKALRGDLAATSRDTQFSFRQTVEPVYRELVSLLLTDAPNQDELQSARATIEALRLAELDNFFREACLDGQPVAIESLDPKAAVIYPILLPDRLAVIVSRADAPLEYYSLAQPRAEVEAAAAALLANYHPAADNQERLRRSQAFYDWLVRPAETQGWLDGIETLVFVLDGNLRQLPVAALFDGDRYLVERYGIALSQGLQLLQPRNDDRQPRRTSLVAGLTEARGGFTALPGVAAEFERLEETLPTSRLMNDGFTKERLQRAVARRPVEILHLATHGQFGSRPEDTFLQAWDGPIDLRAIDELLLARSAARADAGLDLLVLSACETAAGDDLAILGLAGFAVRSGAQSTVATLWQVRDRSTARLMGHFYEQLQAPTMAKAEALRRAQIRLLQDVQYNHPFFWAPFVLVGHWR